MKLTRQVKLYVSTLLIYGLGILIFFFGPFYTTYLTSTTKKTLLILYFTFIVLSPLYYKLYSYPHSTNKPYLFIKNIISYIKNKTPFSKEWKIAARFLLVKLFFLPLMIQFTINNVNWLSNNATSASLYPLLLTIIFLFDTGIFAFGYAFEMPQLKNVVKSVEPTFFGWFVAIICYPPFNSITGDYIPWGANDYVIFSNPTLTTIMQIIIITLFLIYLWATFALGTKASNLTNRGIVTKFPYSIIRHPAYISKNLVWWLTLLPVMTWQFALGMCFWSLIYYARAITEENHLKQDPDYLAYCKKVKYKFIPKVW